MKFSVRQTIVNILLIIISLVLFFGSLEIWARYKYWGGFLKEKGFYSRGKTYTPKKQTPIRMVCIGGSTTHGGGNIPWDKTYPIFIEEIINEKFGKRFIEVLNSGLPATPTEFHRDFVKERIGDQELDILLVHSLYNHFASFYPSVYDPRIDKIFIEHTSKIRVSYRWDKMRVVDMINIFLMEHSYFYVRLREKLSLFRGKSLDQHYSEISKEKEGFLINEEAVTNTQKTETDEAKDKVLSSFVKRYYVAIEEIILAAKAKNVDVILIIPPYPFSTEEMMTGKLDYVYELYYRSAFEKGKQVLIQLGLKHGVLVIDADKAFQERGRNAELFGDHIHLTEKGNYMLAEIIVAEMFPYLKKIESSK